MAAADLFGKTRMLGEVPFEGSAASGIQLLLPDGSVLGAGGRIIYSTGQAALRDLGVYELTGRRVRSLAGEAAPGSGGIVVLDWDGRDDRGRALPGGVYWVRLTTTAGDRNARVVVIR
jgi:flagellar hook assembly protein FlgD